MCSISRRYFTALVGIRAMTYHGLMATKCDGSCSSNRKVKA